MIKKIASVTLALSIAATSLTAFAFSDMAEERLSWALDAVEEMSDKGIIKGYEDGTFKPDKAVTKEEAMVLISRICGYNEDSSEEYVEIADEVGGSLLEKYNTQYASEVSYVIYRGLLSSEDLASYFADDLAKTALKRYEAAILLSKLSDYECTIEEKSSYDLTFSDRGSIPGNALPYVEYAVENGLMNGMGDNLFIPEGEVTRAQMATLLYRVMNKMNFEFVTGVFSEYDEDATMLKIVEENDVLGRYTAKKATTVMLDGEAAELADIKAGDTVRLTLTGDTVTFAEAISADANAVIEAIYEKSSKLTDSTVILVKDAVTGDVEQYALGESLVVKKDNASATVADLVKGDSLKITLKNGKVSVIIAEEKEKTVNGTVDKIELEPEFKLYITAGGETKAYATYDDVSVRRNGENATLASIMAGDSVTLTLEYNVITKIIATSKQTKKSGKVSEIVISVSPKISIKSDDTVEEYYVLNAVEITRNGSEAEIYDIRLGDSVTVTLEGDTVTKISLTASAEASTITGEITYCNSSYGYIQLDSISELVFTNKAKIQDKAGSAMNLKALKPGMSVTVFGTTGVGSVEASLIIVND